MMIRIVKLTFRPDTVEHFLAFIAPYRPQIAAVDGCEGVEFLRDKTNKHILFTYSHWRDEGALAAYRDSELFATVWSQVKPLFGDQAEAWSLESY